MWNTPSRLQAYQLLHDGIQAFARAEAQGMRVDLDYCERKTKHLTRKIERLERKFKETKFFRHWEKSMGKKKPNIDSNWQLAHYLYDKKGIEPPKTTPSGKGATDEDTLKQIGIPEVEMLLEIRKLKKIRDTYLDAFMREQTNGIIHPFFHLHTTITYRSSSDRPNFQNIPKRDKEAMKICRKAILPRKGHQLLEVDYSGIEVRISQCYHEDPTMEQYLTNPDSDMHGDMAKQIFKLDKMDKNIPELKYLRDAAKNGFVFPQFYGDYYGSCTEYMACKWGGLSKGTWKSGKGVKMPGGKNLSDHLISKGLKSFKHFEHHVKQVEEDFWGRRFRVYQQWKERLWKVYQKKGYIDTLTGFRVGGIMRRNEVINSPIQGSAFHCLLWSFIQLDLMAQVEQWNSKLVGQIHDSILFDVDPEEIDHIVPIIQRVMTKDIREAWSWLIVPLEVEMDICEPDAPWSEKKAFMWEEGKENEGLE